MRKIILASGSPRRQEILTLGGFSYEVKVSQAEEQIPKEELETLVPSKLVERLARTKAEDVFRQYTQDADILVIGADTVVAIDGCVLGKPESKEDAARMLRSLSGRTHEVYTGVCLLWRDAADWMHVRGNVFHCLTEVTFYPMQDAEIKAYIETGECMDKAGSYAIQGGAAKFIQEINGDYLNVVGLPLSMLYHEIQSGKYNFTL